MIKLVQKAQIGLNIEPNFDQYHTVHCIVAGNHHLLSIVVNRYSSCLVKLTCYVKSKWSSKIVHDIFCCVVILSCKIFCHRNDTITSNCVDNLTSKCSLYISC